MRERESGRLDGSDEFCHDFVRLRIVALALVKPTAAQPHPNTGVGHFLIAWLYWPSRFTGQQMKMNCTVQ
jgi:hypothetical protein